jgi:replicative DNA helicase Mcm
MSPTIDDANKEVESNASNSDTWEAFLRSYRSLEYDAANVASKSPAKAYDAYYMNEINDLMQKGGNTVYISFEHVNDAISLGSRIINNDLEETQKVLSRLVQTILFEPDAARLSAQLAAFRILQEMHPAYAKEVAKEFSVQFKDIGIHVEIPEVNHTMESQIISLDGFVTMVDEKTRKDTIESVWICPQGDETTIDGDKKPGKCDYCSARNLKPMPEREKKRTMREFELQQRFDKVGEGRMAMPITVKIIDKDLVNTVKGGDFVKVDGIVRTRKVGKGSDSTSMFYIEASSIEQKSDDQFMNVFQRKTAFLEEQVKHAIHRETARFDYQKCINSIAPSIYGHNIMKESLLLQLIGSPAFTLPDGQKYRGTISLLFCGDPATGKSVLARSVSKLYPRSVLVNAQATTKVGLTASVMRQDGVSRMEAGAYLMARGGIVVLDEMQLLQKEEKGTLLEVMDDNQTIAIQKGGFRTKTPLEAACCTLALGNPLEGRWDRTKNIYENTGLRPENVSRFDLIFVFTDNANPEEDEKVTEHWLKNLGKGIRNEEYENAGEEYIRRIQEIENEGLIHPMQYMAYLIRYIRNEFVPKVKYEYNSPAIRKITKFYLAMRKIDGNLFAPTKDDLREGRSPPKVPAVGPRQLAALVRFTMASAAAHFRTEMTEEDADIAINLMSTSLTSSGFTTTEDISRKSWMIAPVRKSSLTDFDVLRRAEKLHKEYFKEVRRRYHDFEKLVKELGFRRCPDCNATGQQTAGDGSIFPCEVCGGRGGFLAEMSINELIGYLQVRRNPTWTNNDIQDAITKFKKVGAIEVSPRHPSYLKLTGDHWTAPLVDNYSWLDLIVGEDENKQEYGVENFEASQSTKPEGHGSLIPTAYDMMIQNGEEVNLAAEYEKANPVEMQRMEEILQKSAEEEEAKQQEEEEENETTVSQEEES